MQDNKSRGDNRCCRMVGDRFRPLRLSGESSSFRCTNRNNSRSSTNIEQRQQFAAMSAMDKQQYLAQRNLLLPNPSANWDNKFSSSNTQSRSVGPTPMESFWQTFPLKKLSIIFHEFYKIFCF